MCEGGGGKVYIAERRGVIGGGGTQGWLPRAAPCGLTPTHTVYTLFTLAGAGRGEHHL